MVGKIIGIGTAVPEKIVDNNQIATMVETSDEWIQERTGIAKRHAATAETTVDLAALAAERAVREAGIDPSELGLIIVSTISPERIMPAAACEVQARIGAKKACCFDLNAACSGFIIALQTASVYLESGLVKYALVIGSECLTKVTNWADRGSCILFGDGSGAAVLTLKKGRSYLPVLHSDGSQGEALTLTSRYTQSPFTNRDVQPAFIRMNGQEVFKFAVRKVPQAIEEVLEKNALQKEDISYYVIHQANRRIVESVSKRLGEKMEKFPTNMSDYGNTSSASIPLLLWDMKKKGLLQTGQKLILAGFGAGLTWGAMVLDWEDK
ncbi:MAG: beta-ketoacyl-ACP synthase III [Eubacteriales bacterium]|nr:beta-ketoacyl-ACP synthase III [Eubacteriales bacterium]